MFLPLLGTILSALVCASAMTGVSPTPPAAAPPQHLQGATFGLEARRGLFDAYIDPSGGRALVRLASAGADGVLGRYLYTPSIAGGLGASGAGIDRGSLGQTQVIAFRRVGRRVVAEMENERFRATTNDPEETAAVRTSFSASPVWEGDVIEEGRDGTVVVDLASFLERDALDVAGRLRHAKEGTYRLSPALSYVDQAETSAFPDNVEFETKLVLTSEEPTDAMARILPDARSLSVSIHHSFLRLPADGYRPRAFDPRTGTSVQVIFNDYAAGLDQPVVQRLVRRFRLEKIDPAATHSRVKKPIVFYVDRAAPEAIRTALTEGARWWAQAFDAAGFVDAFRVELLPPNVNPMDSRYNIIAWVHGETRGWSTGTTVVDPRTGEIVRGVVQLGSLRAWHDRAIFDALAGAGKENTGASDDPIVLVRARLRQLAVHEVGHALGLAHNFAGSAFAGRASVMDYPAPLIHVRDGALDFTQAYATGVGAWDKFAIHWLYGEYPRGVDEQKALDRLTQDAISRGYRYVTDADTRGVGAVQPWGSMWDNGDDAVAELAEVLDVRRVALDHFGLANLPAGAPAADLRRLIAPLYLYHRYQVTAVSKLVGGLDYAYAVKGDGHEKATAIPPARQRAALAALVRTLDPGLLDLPDRTIALLSSAQSGTADHQFEIELLPSGASSTFDLPAAAASAADITFEALLAPERLNRLVEQQRTDPGQLSLGEMLETLSSAVARSQLPGRQAELQRRVRARYAGRLAGLLEDSRLSPTVASLVQGAAERLGDRLKACAGDTTEKDSCRYLSAHLTGTSADLKVLATQIAPEPEAPPGAPIGESDDGWFGGAAERALGTP